MESRKGLYFFGDNRRDPAEQDHLLVVKRPGLRPEELQSGSVDQLKEWQWWLTPDGLVEEVNRSDFDKKDAIALVSGPEPESQDVEMTITRFCLCHEFGIYPPDWIIEDLYQRFAKWVNANRRDGDIRSLDDFFQLPGKNRPAFFKRVNESEFWWNECDRIQFLRIYFKVSYEDAISITANIIDRDIDDLSFECSSDVIEKRYKEWRKGRELKAWEISHVKLETPAQHKEFLAGLPREALSPHLEKYPLLKTHLED